MATALRPSSARGSGAAPKAPARIRGPRGHLIAGHLPHLRRDSLGFLTACAREHGDFVPLRFLVQRAALVSHPDAIEEVLVTRQQQFTRSPSLRRNRRLLGDGLVTSVGELWRQQRRLMQPAFHRQRMAAYGDVMVSRAEALLATWEDGQVRDLHQDMMYLTLDVVGRTLFGTDLADDAARVGEALTAALARFEERLFGLSVLLPENAPTPGNRRFEHAARQLDEVVYGIIDRRRRHGAGAKTCCHCSWRRSTTTGAA